MDIKSLVEQPALPVTQDDAVPSGSASNGADPALGTNKRKHEDLMHLDPTPSSPPPRLSSPAAPPSSPPPTDRSASNTPVPGYPEAKKAYIARAAPHLLDRLPTPSGSRTPSGRSSPTSEDDAGALTPDGASSIPASSNQSHHTLPPNYRGPPLRKNDAEDIAPAPHLTSAAGSSTLFNTVNFAINRNGWRYTAAGPSSQGLPQTTFKTLETRPAGVHWCWSDRSPFTTISADADIVSTDKGFRSARSNIGVREGEWFAEIEILPPEQLEGGASSGMKDGPHIRLGWGRREAPLNAPVGFDGFSYGFRDKTGDKVTLSRPLPYGKPFRAGDVVGMYIKLPPVREPQDENDPAIVKRERIAIRYKGQLYFESLEYPRTREMEQLMERSRKGNSIEEALKGIEGTGVFQPHNPADLATNASGDVNGAVNGNGVAQNGSSGGGGSAKVKNRKNPGKQEKPSGPSTPSLRPVPKLEGSKVGFFVNGEPQGVAFRDLFDYRPLRVKGFTNLKPAPPPAKGSSSRSAKQANDATEPVINVKARENVFDDGALGYFPFISSYGGARGRLITGEDGFRFPPPDDIEAALEGIAAEEEGGRRWKPLSARFEEHLAEMWKYDLADEEKAQEVARKQAEEKARRNNAAKERYAAAKKKHADALARNSTPSLDHAVEVDRRATSGEDHEADTAGRDAPSNDGTPAPQGTVGEAEVEEISRRASSEVETPPPQLRLPLREGAAQKAGLSAMVEDDAMVPAKQEEQGRLPSSLPASPMDETQEQIRLVGSQGGRPKIEEEDVGMDHST